MTRKLGGLQGLSGKVPGGYPPALSTSQLNFGSSPQRRNQGSCWWQFQRNVGFRANAYPARAQDILGEAYFGKSTECKADIKAAVTWNKEERKFMVRVTGSSTSHNHRVDRAVYENHPRCIVLKILYF
ncbi:hypothetical protein GQ600_10302 [Phytophthora cactorum]|nr:hypothetical protein GQ600_10302 [Phytophthora cactorum]